MTTRLIYINIKNNNSVETVDEFEYNNLSQRKYARDMLKEYRLSDKYNHYYFSQRCTNDWKQK